jgi:hypothetical protein
MKAINTLAAVLTLAAGTAGATERYTEARIIQIEASETAILVFLQLVSGDAPPLGNGLTNQPVNQHWLFLANSSSDIANRRHLLASALTAHALGSDVRIRWEDAGAEANRIVALLSRESL